MQLPDSVPLLYVEHLVQNVVIPPFFTMWIMCISFQVPEMLKKTQGVGPIRKVILVKDDHEGLGISITVRYLVYVIFTHTRQIQSITAGWKMLAGKASSWNISGILFKNSTILQWSEWVLFGPLYKDHLQLSCSLICDQWGFQTALRSLSASYIFGTTVSFNMTKLCLLFSPLWKLLVHVSMDWTEVLFMPDVQGRMGRRYVKQKKTNSPNLLKTSCVLLPSFVLLCILSRPFWEWTF